MHRSVIRIISTSLLIVLLSTAQYGQVLAATLGLDSNYGNAPEGVKRAMGIYFTCGGSNSDGSSTADSTQPQGGDIVSPNAYVLGDSISHGLQLSGLATELKAKLKGDAKINYDDGRSITVKGSNGNEGNTPALDAVTQDQDYIKTAGVIIIVLGTNQTDDPFDQNQKLLLQKLKALAPDANYYWLDIGATAASQVQGWDARNKILYQNAASEGYSVISRYKAMFGDQVDPLNLNPSLNIPGSPDNIHGDYDPVVGAIVNAVNTNNQNTGTTNSTGQCCDATASQGGLGGGTLPASVPAPYNAIFTAAASKANADPLIVATIFLTENGFVFPNPPPPYGTGPAWPSSPAGAQGPFQFLSLTWATYGQNGNIQDLKDAANGAARFIVSLGGKSGIPLGDLSTSMTNKPSVANVLGSYNAGPAGNFFNNETTNYITKGLAIYQKLQAGGSAGDFQSAASSATSPDTSVTANLQASGTCSSDIAGAGGAVIGNIIQTAENFSWPDFQAYRTAAKPSYQTAWSQYDNASNMTDCSAFVATVMIATGTDPNYPKAGTAAQMAYVKAHPEKYAIIQNPTSTSQLKPGDIMIHDVGGNGHTLIYIGDSHWQGADASLGSHTPQVSPDVTWMFSQPNDIAVRIL